MEEERQKDNINQLHERLVKLKKKILSGISAEEKKKILSDFDWNHYREYSVKILMIKREVIIEQKKEGKEKFDLWLADIKEWEKKNMNNYDDNLKSKYFLEKELSFFTVMLVYYSAIEKSQGEYRKCRHERLCHNT